MLDQEVKRLPDGIGPDGFEPAVRVEHVHFLSRPSLSYWKDAWIRLKKNRQALTSLYVCIFLIAFAGVGPLLWTADPGDQDLSRISESPSWSKQAVVISEDDAYQEVIDPNIPETIPIDQQVEKLSKVEGFSLNGLASTLGVRLNWKPVVGATGYQVYRSISRPSFKDELGVLQGDVDGANRLSFQDTLNLEEKTYYYSIVAKNEKGISEEYSVLDINVKSSILLFDAVKINSEVKSGEMVTLPKHPFGTDYLGRDLLARIMAGGRVSLFIGFFAPLFYILIGVVIGGISGFYSGMLDQWVMRITDLITGLPFLLFMILFKITLGGGGPGESGIKPMLIALILLSWTSTARLTRGQILQLRESEFVQAARLLGGKPKYLIFRHLIPNTMGVILISLTFSIPSVIFTEAWLSFIGMGVAPPTPSWGSMANEGIERLLTHPHELFFPSLFISIAVLAFNLVGDGLRDALDPKLRSTE